jgi:transcriptional regulator with XRE-family HTH domain
MCLEEAIAKVLKKNRLKLGYSQEELADRCSLDRTYISLLERGLRKPTLKVIFEISKVLDLHASDFVRQIEDLL